MKHSFEFENAIVVGRDMRGESSVYISVLSREHGLMQMMKKVSVKTTSLLPDLFDDISGYADAQTPQGLKFLRDFEISKRRTEIGKSYEAFNHAALIASVVAVNGRNIEDCARLEFNLRHALDAIAKDAPPEIVRFKFMYLLARNEGYPVKEDFFESLPEGKREMFSLFVKTPSLELREFRSRASDMLDALCRWIYANTDISESY